MGKELSNIQLINILLQERDCNIYQNTSDLFEMLRLYEEDDKDHAHALNKLVRDIANKQAKNKLLTFNEQARFYELYKRALLFDAPFDFDAFCLYVEFDREPEKRFYAPRRKTLRIVANDLQDLHDRKIKFLAVSLPPRVGKSTLCIFYLAWLMGKYPDKPNLMTGHSDKLTKGFHKEVISIINGDQYLYHDVFPSATIKKVSAEDETIDINAVRRYPTLTCRSILGSLTGVIDIEGLAYIDDVIEDIEEALNPNRMDTKYDAYLNQVIDRMKEYASELQVGTRWNVNDVIGRTQDLYGDDPNYRFRVIPALDENDESNFDFPYGVGFSTEKYLDIRKKLENNGDLATWYAKYQCSPYVREGLVFPEADLKYYEILPDGEPTVYACCDVAWGGGDSLSMPFAYEYSGEVYIPDWVFSKGDKFETRPMVLSKIIIHKPHYCEFEANNGGHMYSEDIEEALKSKNLRINITNKTSPSNKNKHAEILTYAPDIRKFHFLKRELWSDQYRAAMKELFVYLMNGKAKHDDSPDGLRMVAKKILEGSGSYEIEDRIF